jgi:DNA primase
VAQWANVRWSGNWSGHGAVVFPIHNRQGDVIAAQGRAVAGRAKLTAGPKKEGAFFAPVELASHRRFGPLDHAVSAIVLVEAPLDALSLATCGFPALALCGTSGPSWLHLACGLRRVVLAFDADEAGERASDEMALLLRPFGARCSRLRPLTFKDWNEWLIAQGTEEVRDFLDGHLL